jgi:hypothetical protein
MVFLRRLELEGFFFCFYNLLYRESFHQLSTAILEFEPNLKVQNLNPSKYSNRKTSMQMCQKKINLQYLNLLFFVAVFASGKQVS